MLKCRHFERPHLKWNMIPIRNWRKKTPQVVDLPPFHSHILFRGWKHKDRYQNFHVLRTILECIQRDDKILRRETNLLRNVVTVMRAKSCARGVTWFGAMFALHFCTHSTNMVLGWKFSRFCKTISVKFHVLQVWCRFFERYFFWELLFFCFCFCLCCFCCRFCLCNHFRFYCFCLCLVFLPLGCIAFIVPTSISQ